MLNFSEYKDAERVFYFFEEISKIPRGSGNTEKIADFLVNFAIEKNLAHYRDGANNVIIKKPAARGYESRPTVILQGHTDMVIAIEPDVTRDIEKDGLELYIDGDFLRARGTTLGADNGIAVSYMLALLEDSFAEHPALECLFTSDEEIGLIGASELDAAQLDGKIMLNLDSDDEGIFIAGCAGGMRMDIRLDTEKTTERDAYKLSVHGLLGGHSGAEINKGRINAIKLLADIIPDGAMIGGVSGGNADNAIPRNAECYIANADKISDKIEEALEKYKACEQGLAIEYTKFGKAALLSEADTTRVLSLIREEPCGPIAMNKEMPTLVETSLNHGIISSDAEGVNLTISLRSSKDQEKLALADRVTDIAKKYGCKVNTHGSYPGWEYKQQSHLREVLTSTYEKLTGKVAKVVTIHAGLECGIFSGKIKDLDCVSFGPTAYDIHTTEERVSLSSTESVYKLLKEALKAI